MKKYILVFLVLFALTIPALVSCSTQPAADHGSELKAAIVDQLYSFEPNQAFIDTATTALESYGFSVDVWRSEEIDVNFYRELPRHGYKLILFRAHLGILCHVDSSQTVPMETTCLFAGETYTTTKYVAEQLVERVQEAKMAEEHPTVFAVSPDFISDNVKGEFDNTVIVMMGCASHHLDDMAVAFVEKGASAYLGWSATVTLDYVDTATLDLIDNLCIKNMTIEQATSQTMAKLGKDPYYHARLKYTPAECGNQTVTDLTN